MNTILNYLEEKPGTFISGTYIAKEMNMSRANVWKCINKLKSEGYQIEAIPNKGYRLIDSNGNISESAILSSLKYNDTVTLQVLKRVDSTNLFAKQLASSTNIENHVIVSDFQTKGKGRLGRTFHSPEKKGIYMSLILRPKLSINEAQLLTMIAATSVVEAINKCIGIRVDIKWLNDIYFNNKKLCGILTEGEITLETGSYDYLVVGIGINVFRDELLPSHLHDIYTSLSDFARTEINRNALIATIIDSFFALYSAFPENKECILDSYRQSCITLGRKITLCSRSSQEYLALDIDNFGHLVVKDNEDTYFTLCSGEVSDEGVC